MYDCYKSKIVEGVESFPIFSIIGENLLFLTIWSIAGFLFWPVWSMFNLPILTILWIVLVLIIQILLKKHNCSGCYYYDKLCHLGWGKLSSALFKQDSGDPDIGMKLSLFYIITPPLILIVSLIHAFITSVDTVYWVFLVLFVVFNVLSFPIRKHGCSKCAMRKACPGSALKDDLSNSSSSIK